MESVNLPIQWAPGTLNQPILPGWQFSLFSVNVGQSENAEVEKEAIKSVGSYGKQIGHLAEALEVVIRLLQVTDMPMPETDKEKLTLFLADVIKANGIKRKVRR